MLARLLVPALVLALVGCIPTFGKKCSESSESATSCCDTPSSDCCSGEEAGSDCCSAGSGQVAKGVELKVLKYDQLTEAVRAHKGKVVIVDVWASFCTPCKKEFPHLVEIHRKYGPEVVCVSVSVDQPEDAEKAVEFLKKVNATFPNYRLDEESSVWQDKWDITAIPAVFVFDRDGKRAGKFTMDDPDNQFTYEANVEPLVRKLVKVK